MLDFFSVEFWSALAGIFFINLLLSGDNALVIAMASRNMPKELQKKVIFWGMAGAVLVRIVSTILIMYLLRIPYLLAIGGLVLLWISFRLLVEDEDKKHGEVKANSSLGAAVRTIVVADAAMGLDNVLAIAGMAKGNMWLIVFGLLISIPIVIWGSTLFLALLRRFPWIIYLGGGLLAYTAAEMLLEEERLAFLHHHNPMVTWPFTIAVVALVIVAGLWVNTAKARKAKKEPEPAYAIEENRE